MDWKAEKWLAPSLVETPDVVGDVRKYIDPAFTANAFSEMAPENQHKLTVLVERLEFIDRLSVIASVLRRQRTTAVRDTPLKGGMAKRTETYSIVVNGHDFAGFDFDTDALVVYLLLTCIDTLKGQARYLTAFEWLKDRISPGSTPDLDTLRKEYENQYGLSKRFKEAFTDDCSEEIKDELVANLAVVKVASQEVKKESAQAWEKRKDEEKLMRIASELYSVRSRFTHTSLRTFSPEVHVRKSLERKGSVLIQRAEGPSLRQMLLKAVEFLACKLIIGQD